MSNSKLKITSVDIRTRTLYPVVLLLLLFEIRHTSSFADYG